MKDLEKIKSEDLVCQVQDANPGNFAIEQDVAAMVGATVPQPTEPSDDDARELGAQLLVFLRRALTPIQTALRTALAAIYAHLDSRCTDYTPAGYAPYQPLPSYDPMGTPPTPRTLPNLLTALTAFSARKISNGSAPNDGIPDGTSLAHLLCSTDGDSVVEIKDDNSWGTATHRNLATALSLFPNLKRLTMNCNGELSGGAINGRTKLEEVTMPKITKLRRYNSAAAAIVNCQALKEVNLESVNEVYADGAPDYPCIHNCAALEKVKLGTITVRFANLLWEASSANLLDIELGQGSNVSINLARWTPTLTEANTATFLQNFKEHIALRLTSNGSGKTLTLSQAVFDTIWNADGTPKSTDPDSVIYQINKIIKTDKHWSVNRA